MKKLFSLSIILLMGLLVACGNSNTSSENARSASETSETGAVLTTNFESAEVDAKGILSIEYTITSPNGEELAGTIHWGDNTTSRIKGAAEARHRYRSSGTYRVNVQLDDGSVFRLGQIRSTVDSSTGSGTKVFRERDSFSISGNNFLQAVPNQTLRFDASDIVPTSDAEFVIEVISGDLNSQFEYFNILVNGRTFKSVGGGRGGIRQCRPQTQPLRFSIPLEDLIAERNSNSGQIRIVFIPTNPNFNGNGVGNGCRGSGRTRASATLTFTGK